MGLTLVAAVAAQLDEGAAQDPVHREPPVQGRVGVLEDDLQRADVLGVALVDARWQQAPVELDD